MAKQSDFQKIEKIILKDLVEDLCWIEPSACKVKGITVTPKNPYLATMLVNATAKSKESFLEALLDKELFNNVGKDRKVKVPGGRDKGQVRVHYGKRVLKDSYIDSINEKIARICNLFITEVSIDDKQIFITIEAE